MNAHPATARAGFTLVEILIAVTIVVILGAVVGINVLDAPQKARVGAAKQQLSAFKTALGLYAADNGAVRDGGDAFPDDTPVSMNFWGFKRRYVDLLEESFPRFLAEKGALPKSEFQIPTEVAGFLREGRASVRVLRTAARWYGVTSRDDRPEVAAFLSTLPSPFA